LILTILHGGQTGVDRGAHEATIDNGWRVAGYMPRDQRDELGRIPSDVARFLVPHDKTGYSARTEANVSTSSAVLIVVRNADDPRTTPGTTKTIDLAIERHLRRMVVDPRTNPTLIARWIWFDLRMIGTLPLPLAEHTLDPIPTRLLVAGPRESKWPGAQAATAGLLRQVALALAEIPRTSEPSRDLARTPR
jgi:hypothetical protein